MAIIRQAAPSRVKARQELVAATAALALFYQNRFTICGLPYGYACRNRSFVALVEAEVGLAIDGTNGYINLLGWS
jgi:hypothetical protein